MPELFPFLPDWQSGITVEHEYLTSIIEHRHLREQRISERIKPRKKISQDFKFSKGELARFHGLMSHNIQSDFLMPEESRYVTVTAAASAASSHVAVDEVPGWLHAGAYLELRNGSTRAVVSVDSWGSGQINLTNGLISNWPVGTRVFYLDRGRFQQSFTGAIRTNMVGEYSLSFTADPGPRTEALGAVPQTFNGRELWLMNPNWGETPSATGEGYLDTIDYSRGVLDHFEPVNFSSRTMQFTYLQRTSADAESMLQFFMRMRGRQGEFYMPSWEPEIDVSGGSLGPTDTLTIPGTDFYELYSGSNFHTAVIILMKDGTYVAKSITSITTDGTDSILAVNGYWGKVINPQTVRLACFLHVWRLATDTLSVGWVTRSVAQTKLSMKMLEDLA